MLLGIVSRKIIDPIRTRIIYRASFINRDRDYGYDEFVEWLAEQNSAHRWHEQPYQWWKFDDPVDDVTIRLYWSKYLSKENWFDLASNCARSKLM